MATKTIVRYRSRPKRRHGRPKATLSLGILAGLAPTAAFAYDGFKVGGDQGGIVEAAHRVTMRLTGYEWKGGVWSAAEFTKGWVPLLVGAFVHKTANRFGVNRMIARAGIPLLRI